MTTANRIPQTQFRTSSFIEQLRRRTAANGGDPVPASVYEAQDAHWAAHYASRPYVDAGDDYADYAPAYLYGVFWYHSNPEQSFEAGAADLSKGWDSARGDSPLEWPKAKAAVEEAWYQVRDLAERSRSERAELLATTSNPPMPGDH